ncbi:DNA polymerase I [Streptomyces phage Marky]|nr:DNA polymerase I [Streptomyces phage Marky]
MIDLKPSRLPRLRPGSWISLDTETSGLYPDDGARVSAVSVAWFQADEIGGLGGRSGLPAARLGVCGAAFPFGHGVEIQPWFSGAFALFGGDEDVNLPASEWEALVRWLADKHIVMHNALYDLIMTDAGLPVFAPAGARSVRLDDRVKWDTMLGCKNLWPTHEKGLGPTASRLKLGTKLGDPVKDWIKKNKAKYVKQGYPTWGSGYDLVPWMLMGEYAAEDAVLTLLVFEKQRAEFLDGYGDWAEFNTKQMPLMFQFTRMERRGLPFPAERSAGFVGVLEKAAARVGKALPFTPTKTAAVSYFFESGETARGFECLNLEPIKVSDRTGAVSLDADVIGDLAFQEVPHAKEWKLYTDLHRVASMYYGGYADKTGADGRLRARIRQIRDITKNSDGMGDRLSIERVNLQAMPQDRKLTTALEGLDMPTVRTMIADEVADRYEEWELFELDLSQAELRVGALLSGCAKMLKAFNEGEDLHQNTADLIGADRKTAKMSNFLLIFDGGWLTFKTQVKIQTGGDIRLNDAEAKNIVYPWKRTYPQYKRMADKWEAFAKRTGYVPLANGVLRWFTFREDKRKGWNQIVQGSIQQLFQDWLLEAEEICERWGVMKRAEAEGIGGAGPLMTVHDSIILLLPREHRVAIVEEIQAAAIRLWDDMFPGVPGAVDAKAFGKD